MTERERVLAARDVSVFGVGSSPEGAPGPDHPESIETGLIEAGTRLALAGRLRADAMTDLAAWMRVARAEGMLITRIAKLGGVTRPTVYACSTPDPEQEK